MSKTAQRKRQSFTDGFLDGKQGHGVAWRTHPYLEQYKAGHKAGLAVYNRLKQLQKAPDKPVTFISRVRNYINKLRVS